MAKPKIKWNRDAFRQVRLLPEVAADVHGRAERIAVAAGDGYEAFPTQAPRSRARAAVVTTSFRAIRENARNQTLLRHLDAGR
jgi:hypothetical protein